MLQNAPKRYSQDGKSILVNDQMSYVSHKQIKHWTKTELSQDYDDKKQSGTKTLDHEFIILYMMYTIYKYKFY